MASRIIQGDPNNDKLTTVENRLEDVRRQLDRVHGTKGVVVTEPKLEAIIDAILLLTEEVRSVRDVDQTGSDGDIPVFDETPPQP
jgi:hypothetical protein